jgi:Spy/CpxP family protein refolding chaperone
MMSIIRRSVAVVASAAVMTLLMTGGYPLGAQETGSAKSQTTKGKQAKKADSPAPAGDAGKTKATGKSGPPDPTHRVPPGYGRLGLTDQQKAAIYKVQAKYSPQIRDLEKQADELRAKRDAECEAILTPAQRRQLAQQEQQKKAAAEKRKADAAAKPAENGAR